MSETLEPKRGRRKGVRLRTDTEQDRIRVKEAVTRLIFNHGSIRKAAIAFGVSNTLLSYWLSGKCYPGPAHLARLHAETA